MHQHPSILIIDDNADDRLLAQLVIEDSGLCDEIFFAQDGEEALQFLTNYIPKQNQPLLALLDINMPITNGFEFLERYSDLIDHENSSIPIVLEESA